MNTDSQSNGTLRYIRARWPIYLIGFAGGALGALLLIILAVEVGAWSLVFLGLIVLLILSYFFTTSLWAANEQFNRRHSQPSHVIFELGHIQPTDDLVYVGLGLRDTPIQLSRRLTRGHVRAIDVYNPQLAPGRALARQRRPTPLGQPDPRLTWLDGNIDLLPLPDHSAPVAATSFTLFEFWQHGDRKLLLSEMYRILQPGGQLLIAEPARTRTQLMLIGPAALRLPPPDYWRQLVRDVGFRIAREENIGDFYLCFRAEKPLPGEIQQLALDLGV